MEVEKPNPPIATKRTLFQGVPPFPEALAPFIKEVGRGKKGARDLTREQARDAMRIVLSGEASSAQIGAFFQAFRIKSETPDELAGMIEAARECCSVSDVPAVPERVEIGMPYDGKLRGFHVLPGAALLAAKAGVQTFFHGDAGVGPKFGINVIEVLYALGIPAAKSIEDAVVGLRQRGVAFCAQNAYSPTLARLRSLRNEVAVRGPLSTVEKTLNLTRAAALLTSNTHTPYGPIMSGALHRVLGEWRVREAWIVQGAEGHADLDPRRHTSARRATTSTEASFSIDLGPNSLASFSMPKDDWAAPSPPDEIDPRDSGERARWIDMNATWIDDVLSGRESRGLPAILETAAMLLTLAGVTPAIADGILRAQKFCYKAHSVGD